MDVYEHQGKELLIVARICAGRGGGVDGGTIFIVSGMAANSSIFGAVFDYCASPWKRPWAWSQFGAARRAARAVASAPFSAAEMLSWRGSDTIAAHHPGRSSSVGRTYD